MSLVRSTSPSHSRRESGASFLALAPYEGESRSAPRSPKLQRLSSSAGQPRPQIASPVSSGLAGLQLELLGERSERRKLEEEVHRLQCLLGELRGVGTAHEASLSAARRECAEMEQLFLEQRRRNGDLETALRRAESAAGEVEVLRRHLGECRQQLLSLEREAFERDLGRDADVEAAVGHVRHAANAEARLERLCATVELAESERRVTIASDGLRGLVEVFAECAGRASASLCGAARQQMAGATAAESLRISQETVARMAEASRGSEAHAAKTIGELRAMLAKADERSADALRAVQSERDANALLRQELLVAKERVGALLTIGAPPPPSASSSASMHADPHSHYGSGTTHGDASSRRHTSPLRSRAAVAGSTSGGGGLYTPLETSLFSPHKGTAADAAELAALRREVKALREESEANAARDTSHRSNTQALVTAEAEAKALRSRVTSLEHDLFAAREAAALAERRDAREAAEAHAARQQQMVLLAQKASAAEREATQHKELAAALQHRIAMAQEVVEASKRARGDHDAVVAELNHQVDTLTRELRRAREEAAAAAAVGGSSGGGGAGNGASLHQANRRLELVINEMSAVKAENVSLRAQLSAAAASSAAGLGSPRIDASAFAALGGGVGQPSRGLSPLRSSSASHHGVGRHLTAEASHHHQSTVSHHSIARRSSPSRDGSAVAPPYAHPQTRSGSLSTADATYDRHRSPPRPGAVPDRLPLVAAPPHVRGGGRDKDASWTDNSAALSASAVVASASNSVVLSPWRAADDAAVREIKALADRNAYLEAVLSEQRSARNEMLLPTPARAPAAPPLPSAATHSSKPSAALAEPSRAVGGSSSAAGVGLGRSDGITLRMGRGGKSPSPSRAPTSLFFPESGVGGKHPRPAPALAGSNSPNRSLFRAAHQSHQQSTSGLGRSPPRRHGAGTWTPDAPVATETAKRRREAPGTHNLQSPESLRRPLL